MNFRTIEPSLIMSRSIIRVSLLLFALLVSFTAHTSESGYGYVGMGLPSFWYSQEVRNSLSIAEHQSPTANRSRGAVDLGVYVPFQRQVFLGAGFGFSADNQSLQDVSLLHLSF